HAPSPTELYTLSLTRRSSDLAPMVSVDEPSATVTEATGIGVTVMVAEPLTPSLVALIVAVPGATLDTMPLSSTLATPLLELVQRSEEHTSELQSRGHLVCRLL